MLNCSIINVINPKGFLLSLNKSDINLKAGFHFSEFVRAKPLWSMRSGIEKKPIWLAFAHSGREKVELDSTSRTDRAFASKRSLSAWISSCACPDSPSLGRAAELAEVETGLKVVFRLSRSGWPKRTGFWPERSKARGHFSRHTLSKFPRFGRPDRARYKYLKKSSKFLSGNSHQNS